MESKYYTPELEEFHVGFEFEALLSNGNDIPRWENLKMTSFDDVEIDGRQMDWSIFFVRNLLSEHKIRVKHIDEEDIISLNWKINDKKEPIGYFGFEVWVIRPFVGTKLFEIFKEGKLRFFGILKNKSEFKRLMNQLGICK